MTRKDWTLENTYIGKLKEGKKIKEWKRVVEQVYENQIWYHLNSLK
jgi:hypothetical protein